MTNTTHPKGFIAARPAGSTACTRVMLRDDLRDADGQPRICLDVPGRRLPLAFPSLAAALAAARILEATR